MSRRRRSPLLGLLILLFIVGCGDPSTSNGSGSSSGDGDSQRPVDNTPPVDTLEECGGFEEGDDLNVCTATYLGGSGENEAVAVAIDEEGRILVAGNWQTPPEPQHEDSMEAEGPGALAVLSPTGSEVLDLLTFSSTLRDISLNPTTNELAVALSESLQVWDLSQRETVWEVSRAGIEKVAFDQDLLAVQSGTNIAVFDASGELLSEIDVDRTRVNDIAVHGELEQVYITGFHQVSGNLQQPFLFAYAPTGERVWTNWNWSAEEAGELSSDTRGQAVGVGRDGKLYYAGESHGGVTTHFRDPTDIDEEAPLVRRDAYSQSHNWNGAAPLGFVARLDPATGAFEGGQLLAVRLSDGRGNGVGPRLITANEEGVIFVGGGSACCIERWEEKTVAGHRAMPGYGGGQWVMALPPDFDNRPLWTTFNGGAPGADLRSIDARGPAMALVHTHEADDDEVEGNMITTRALTPEAPGGVANIHLVVFPSP